MSSRLKDYINAYRATALVGTAARLGLPDALKEGPRSADALAAALGLHAPSLLRLMRGLVLLDVLAELADGRFALGPEGQLLRADVPGSMRSSALLAVAQFMPSWANLEHTVRTGEVAFDHRFGMTVWEHREAHPEIGAAWVDHLASVSQGALAVVARELDLGAASVVADIGGGSGTLLAEVLRLRPALRGVVFDLPQVAADAEACLRRLGLAERARFVAGDMFAGIGVEADALVIKSVLHNWDDTRCALLLANCRRAMRGPDARLHLVERLMPARVADDPYTVTVDVAMLSQTVGRERTLAEYRDLLARAGLALSGVRPTSAGLVVMVASPA